MFGELTREATNLAERTNVLQARIDRLAIKVTQLDSGVEEGDYHNYYFKIFQRFLKNSLFMFSGVYIIISKKTMTRL